MASFSLLDLLNNAAPPATAPSAAKPQQPLFGDLEALAQPEPAQRSQPQDKQTAQLLGLLSGATSPNNATTLPFPQAPPSQQTPSSSSAGSDLLQQLLGLPVAACAHALASSTSDVGSHRTSPLAAIPSSAAQDTSNSMNSPASAPFSAFVSPFDLLAASAAQIQATQATLAESMTAPSPSGPSQGPLPSTHTLPNTLHAQPAATKHRTQASSSRAGHRIKQMQQHRTPSHASPDRTSGESSVPPSPTLSERPITILQRPRVTNGSNHSGADSPAPRKSLLQSDTPPSPFLALQHVSRAGPAIHGLALHGASPQRVHLDVADPLADSLYSPELPVIGITLFACTDAFSPANKLSLVEQRIMVYATQQGRIRVLDHSNGARLWLKHHTAPVIDHCVGPSPSPDSFQIASTGADGNLLVYRVPKEVDATLTSDDLLFCQISLSPAQPVRILQHPQAHHVLVLLLSDAQVRLIHLDKIGKGFKGSLEELHSPNQRFNAQASGRNSARALLKSLQQSVYDMAISATGNSLVILSDESVRVLGIAQNGTGQWNFDPVSSHHLFKHLVAKPSQVCLIHQDAPSITLAVTSQEGREIHLLDLHGTELAVIHFEGPVDKHYTKIRFDRQHNLLLIAHSCRGSIFAFKVDPASRLLAMVEWPGPKTLVDFTDALSEDTPAIYGVTTGGVAQIRLQEPLAAFEELAARAAEDWVEAQEDHRRMSTDVRDQIHVDIETAVATDRESTASPCFKRRQPAAPSSLRPETPSDLDDTAALEDGLLKNISALINSALETHADRAAAARVVDQAAEIERQEKLLSMVSKTLTDQTSKALDSSVRSEIQLSLLPAVSKLVRKAIDEEIGHSIKASLQKTAAETLGGFLNRADVSNQLIRNFASSAAPIIERSVQEALNTTVIPQFTQATQTLIDTLSREMQQEILSVRKEIVAEQSLALTDLIEDVRQLKHAMLLSGGSLPTGSPVNNGLNDQPPVLHPEQRPQRAREDPPNYEDILLGILSGDNAVQELAQYVEASSDARTQAIFAGQTGRPLVSQAVLLSLSHKLVTGLAGGWGPLSLGERTRLHWFTLCVQNFDAGDATTGSYVPRILDLSTAALSQTRSRLMQTRDMNGVSAVQSAIQAAQAVQTNMQ